jgi:hypothetical protein
VSLFLYILNMVRIKYILTFFIHHQLLTMNLIMPLYLVSSWHAILFSISPLFEIIYSIKDRVILIALCCLHEGEFVLLVPTPTYLFKFSKLIYSQVLLIQFAIKACLDTNLLINLFNEGSCQIVLCLICRACELLLI